MLMDRRQIVKNHKTLYETFFLKMENLGFEISLGTSPQQRFFLANMFIMRC